MEVTDTLILALSRFFIDVWDVYCEGPFLDDIQDKITESPLVMSVEVTEAILEAGEAPEGHEIDDTFYVLSPLGMQAWEIINQHRIKEQEAKTLQQHERDAVDAQRMDDAREE